MKVIQPMRPLVKKAIWHIDESYLDCVLSVLGDRPGIRALLFHSVFSDKAEIECNHIHPQQGLTVGHYRFIFEYFLEHGYRYLNYKELNKTLVPEEKYIYVTFDDGYYNNIRIIPLIEELGIPIHIFVVTDNIIRNRKYWWDAIYFQRRLAGVSKTGVDRELASLKKLYIEEIERYTVNEFGVGAFRPRSDLDRPFAPNELQELSGHELVTIGNHTQKHAIVDTLTLEETRTEIVGAQDDIREITGNTPIGFAFPNGNYRSQDVSLLQSIGIDLAFSCEYRNNRVPEDITGDNRLIMGRYSISGHNDLIWQSKIIRAGNSPFLLAQRLLARSGH
jgi:peptidoglycan/xylan/chitin deacetylase (PgdA/CDA1 family)